MRNNIMNINGQIISMPTQTHKINQESFYIFKIKTKRLSETYDILHVLISDRTLYFNLLKKNQFININGEIRSYNSSDLNLYANQTKLILVIFAHKIIFSEQNNFNQVFLEGLICKNPIYRKTPFGREITDILLITKRFNNKFDHIPCIVWGKNARLALKLNIKSKIKIYGRMQSRQYQKKLITGEVLDKTTYEVSVSSINFS